MSPLRVSWLLLVSATRTQARSIATQASGGGPSLEKLRAVPFSRSLAEARSAYDSYHKSVISYIPSLSPDVRESFLPFWAVSTTACVEILSAQLGFRVIRSVYDFHSKRWVNRVDTDWRWVSWGLSEERPYWERKHDANGDVNMQIYASYEYRRGYVNGLRGVGCFRGARKLTPDMVEVPGAAGGVRGLEEFHMRPSVALDFATQAVRSQARGDARGLLVRMFGADDARDIDLGIVLEGLIVAPVYVPAFIFDSRYLGVDVRTFVHGSTLAVGGQRLYDAPLAAGVAALAAGVGAGVVTGSVPALAAIFVPAAIAGIGALLYPVVAIRFRDWMRQREKSRHSSWSFGGWDEEYVSAFEMWEERARQEQAGRRRFQEEQQQQYHRSSSYRRFQEQQQQYQSRYGRTQQQQQQDQSWYGRAEVDPKGYYAALGLRPGASDAEIKSAFRALALKHHPDRYHTPSEISAAKTRFQKISAAYQVLRDSQRKKIYDESGRD